MHLLEGALQRQVFFAPSFFHHKVFMRRRWDWGRQTGCCYSLAGVDEFVGRLQKILQGDAALRGLQEPVEILEQTKDVFD